MELTTNKLGRGLGFSRLVRSLPILAFFLLALWVGAQRMTEDWSGAGSWAGRIYAVAVSRLASVTGVVERMWEGAHRPSGPSWVQPVSGRLATSFGWRDEAGGVALFDQGITVSALNGAPVESSTGGTVLAVDHGQGEVSVDAGSGLSVVYLGLGTVAVGPGDKVVPEEVLGWVGPAGKLGFQTLVEGRPVDPLGPAMLGKWESQ